MQRGEWLGERNGRTKGGRLGSPTLNCCITGLVCSPAVTLELLCARLSGRASLPGTASLHLDSSHQTLLPELWFGSICGLTLPPGEEGPGAGTHTQGHAGPQHSMGTPMATRLLL